MKSAKTVVVGVTGCVAAYKTCEIIRELQKAGLRAKVVMTESATHFVNPTLFRALTREPVAVGLFDDGPGDPIHHISLAKEADLLLIAPCTANVVAKMACGIADDLLTTTALACTAPMVVAPAMNVAMYEAAATQENLERLRGRGVKIVEAGVGYLACGDEGRGRLAEVADIVAAVVAEVGGGCSSLGALSASESLPVPNCPDTVPFNSSGRIKRYLITAGPTVEAIDPVRFISNHSSGKMGFALALAAAERGAQVTLVAGPTSEPAPVHPAIQVVPVRTAREMLAACEAVFDDADVAVFAAAVSDYRPAVESSEKLKKGANDEALQVIHLVNNPDILATLAAKKRPDQTVVGFAAETSALIDNARAKLAAKGADMIVANLVAGGRVFGSDENEAVLISPSGEEALPPMTKTQLAGEILDRLP